LFKFESVSELERFKKTTTFNDFHTQKPHIFVGLLESFGGVAVKHEEVLGELKTRFYGGVGGDFGDKFGDDKFDKNDKNSYLSNGDFTFLNFFASQDGTMSSFMELFFNSPIKQIPHSKFKKKRLNYTPFEPFLQHGYDVVFITPGKRKWQNLGEYFEIYGVKTIDFDDICAKFDIPANLINTYGTSDIYGYKMALDVLKNAKKPVMIIFLSVSNHPPFVEFDDFVKTEKEKDLVKNLIKNGDKKPFNAFVYSANSLAFFLKNMPTETLVFVSGDHYNRDFHYTEQPVQFATPLLVHLPPFFLEKVHFDAKRVGFHKDIFATLSELVLPKGSQYFSVGGRNIFAKTIDKADEMVVTPFISVKNGKIFQNSKIYSSKFDEKGFLKFDGKGENGECDFCNDFTEKNIKQINARIFE